MKRFLVQFTDYPTCLSCWVTAETADAARLNAMDWLHRQYGVRLDRLESMLQAGHAKIDSQTELLETIQRTVQLAHDHPDDFLDLSSYGPPKSPK